MSNEGQRRHRRRGRGQWQRIIAAQGSSGLSQQAYCSRHGVSYTSFCRWKRELGKEEQPTVSLAGSAFVEVAPSGGATAAQWDVELELGEGVCLRVRRA